MRFRYSFAVVGIVTVSLSGCGDEPTGKIGHLIESHRKCVAAGARFVSQYRGGCTLSHVLIDGGRRVGIKRQVAWDGSHSELRESADGQLVLKTLLPGEPLVREHNFLCMEKAVHGLIGNLNGLTAGVHQIDAGHGGDPACERVTMISDKVGLYPLGDIGLGPTKHLSDGAVARVASAGIRILQVVHSYGIIHGDVYASNFVTRDMTDPGLSMKIIDFGRAIPYLDANGAHVPERRGISIDHLNPFILSPWHLAGILPSRRDDMYRLSELIMLGKYAGPLTDRGEVSVPALIRIKNKRYDRALGLLADFHDAMRMLAFDEEPDYQHWITLFENAAVVDSLASPRSLRT